MGKDVLCGGQGGGSCRAGVQPQCRQPRQHLGLQKMLVLPQYRLPQPGQQPFLRSLLYQKARRAFHQCQRYRHNLAGLGLCLLGQLGGGARRPGKADFCQRALPAQRCAIGHADQRAQLHQRLIVVPGLFRRLMFHDPGGKGLFYRRFCNNSGVIIQAGKHPQHIAVHGGHGKTEADGRDGSGGVLSDAGQCTQGGVVGGQLPAVLRTDELCSLLQVAHPAVIAQPLPQLMQLFLPAGGKRGDIRQRFQKAVVIRQHRRHPGLLQHHLTEPHMVGGGVLPEGQAAAVLVKPLQEGRRNVFHLFCAPC